MGYVILWEGDELWNMLNLPNSELYRLYCPYYNGSQRDRQMNIRSKANKLRRDYKKGKLTMPERDTPYDPNKEPARIEQRRARSAMHLAGKAVETTVITIPVEDLPYHEKLQEALQSDGRIERAIFTSGEHTGYIKNSDNEIEYTDPLKSAKIKYEVTFNTEPKWPVPTRVESGKKLIRKESAVEKPYKTCMIFPDVQIPFSDKEALSVALQILQEVKPDRIVFLGDLLDLSAWSKFDQQPEWATATQGAINEAHQLLSTIRKTLPSAQIQVMAGNHEERMPKTLLRNAQAAYGLKRADSLDSWPVMSVPYLCAFDQLDVEYLPGYPANRVWLNKNLQIRHGNSTRKGGGSSRSSIAAEKVSTINGHDHRVSSAITTVNTFEGGQQIHAYGAGCLCRLDGHVPSYWQGKDLEGTPIRQLEDWQQAFILAHYDDENFHVEQVPINTLNGYQTMYRGRLYEPS